MLSQRGLQPRAFASLRPKPSAVRAAQGAELGSEQAPQGAGAGRWFLLPGHLQSSRIVSATLPSGWGQQEDTCSSAGAVQHVQGLSDIPESNCFLCREEGAIFAPYLLQQGQQQAGLIVLVCSKGFCSVPRSSS